MEPEGCFNEQGFNEGGWNIGPCVGVDENVDDMFLML